MRGAARAVALAVALMAGLGCERAQPSVPRVVLVVVDTLRRDSLGCYGHEGDPTPAIDALARDGTRFERAISSSGWTLPAMASLLTSTWPTVHRALGQRTRLTPISEDVPSGVEALQRAGLRTLAVANAAFVSPYLGLARGFDVFDHRHAFNREIRRADASLRRALELIDQEPASPFFLMVHLFDPHLDYDPPSELARAFAGAPREPAPPLSGRACRALAREGRPPDPRDVAYVRGLYDAEVASVDRALARFWSELAARGLYDDAFVVLTSDHGEEFWEHGGFEHGHTLHDELVRVPLIVKLPKGLPHVPVVSAQVRVLDLLPTLFDLYGFEPPASFVGESLLPLLDGRDDGDRLAFSESTLYGSQKRALRDGRFTYVIDALRSAEVPEALYDWRADPDETRNLIDERPAEADAMRARYVRFAEQLERDAADTRPGRMIHMAPGQLDRVRAALESLGYVGRDEEGLPPGGPPEEGRGAD